MTILEQTKRNTSKVLHLITYWLKFIYKLPSLLKIRKIWKLIPENDLKAHTYLTGKTWCGKSSLTEQRVYYQRRSMRKKQDKTIIVLDPHWTTVESIRKFDLAKDYFNTHIYIDPSLSKWNTPTFNPLECRLKEPSEIELTANQLVTAFEEMIPDARLSNQMKAILKPCLYVLLSLHTCTLEHLQEFMWDENKHWLEHGKNCSVKAYRSFFNKDFNHHVYQRTKQSIYTKIQSLLNSQIFYNLTIGSSTINLSQEIRKWKIILFNLSKWKLGEEISETIGRFLISQIKSIALMRSKLPDKFKKPIYLVIDEADTVIKWNSLNVILKETRKYGLHVFVITQNIVSWKDQEKLKRNLINNTNVKIIGANGLTTLKALSQESWIEYKVLQHLSFHEFRVKYGSRNRKKIKCSNVFWKRSPLLLSKIQMITQTNRMVNKTGYYKPVLQNTNMNEERIEQFPINLRTSITEEFYPKPKFTS